MGISIFSIFCMAFKKVRTFSDSPFLNRGEIGRVAVSRDMLY
jgi:hypothetical protein